MIRVLVVDDEEPARSRLRRLLGATDDFTVIGEAADGAEALERVDSLRPDVVFLDIQMPGVTGLQVARTLTPPRPHVVFCTAYDQHAVDAFELHAIDYLMKPASRGRLATALDRLRRRIAEERDARDAGTTQRRLLPGEAPRLDHLTLAASSRAAGEVGGDYYDYLQLGDGRLGIAVGDVAGHGVEAGLMMAGLQARLQTVAPQHGTDIGRTLTEINRSMESTTSDARYVTLFLGLFDDERRTLSYVNAGHNAPLLLRARDGSTEALAANGLALGLMPTTTYDTVEVSIEDGDLLVGFTDGLSEATGPDGEEYGTERLLAAARGAGATADPAEVRDTVMSDWESFRAGCPAGDDVTLLVARGRS